MDDLPLPKTAADALDARFTPLQQLLRIMARLRAPDGCPWDREQSHATLRQSVIEEAYEVAAASRLTVYVNAEVPELVNESFSALVSADLPIVVERALYSNAEGVTWAAGTNATGTPIP